MADGEYDFQFKLFDDPNVVDANQVGNDVNVPDVDVIDGYFTVELDFGSNVFDGNARWLETAVRPGDSNDPNAFVTLSPRQEVTPTPYALYAENAGADNDWMVSGNNMYAIPSGNIGIGTMTPGRKLEIRENKNDLLAIEITNLNTESLSSEAIYFRNEEGAVAGIRLFDDDSLYHSQMRIFNNRANGSIHLGTDGKTQMVVANSGNVTIATTDPKGHKLYVNGSIGHQTETRYYTIPGVAFTGRYDASDYDKYDSIFRNNFTTTANQYYAPVNIPHGAHLTDMTVGYRSIDSGGALGVHLYQRGLTGGGIYLGGLNPPRGGGSWTTASVSVDAAVDNANNGYYVYLYLQNNGATNHQLVSNVRLTYTVVRPLP